MITYTARKLKCPINFGVPGLGASQIMDKTAQFAWINNWQCYRTHFKKWHYCTITYCALPFSLLLAEIAMMPLLPEDKMEY